jgi:hypothetical protein
VNTSNEIHACTDLCLSLADFNPIYIYTWVPIITNRALFGGRHAPLKLQPPSRRFWAMEIKTQNRAILTWCDVSVCIHRTCCDVHRTCCGLWFCVAAEGLLHPQLISQRASGLHMLLLACHRGGEQPKGFPGSPCAWCGTFREACCLLCTYTAARTSNARTSNAGKRTSHALYRVYSAVAGHV